MLKNQKLNEAQFLRLARSNFHWAARVASSSHFKRHEKLASFSHKFCILRWKAMEGKQETEKKILGLNEEWGRGED